MSRRSLLVAFALGLVGALWAARAMASQIEWEYDLLVDGTATACNPLCQSITIPVGTPLVVDVSFDTSTPNLCGSNPYSGQYNIGFGFPQNSATVDFLGYEYAAAGGIEINTILGSCTTGSQTIMFAGLRLFVGAGVQVAQNGTEIQWIGQFGELFLEIPPSAWLGEAFPTGLPGETSPFGGMNSLGTPNLHFESTELRAVPEPSSLVLLGSGGLIAAMRRRKSMTRCPESCSSSDRRKAATAV